VSAKIEEQSSWKIKVFEKRERKVRRGNTMKQNRKIENNGHMIPFWGYLQHLQSPKRKKKRRGGRERGDKRRKCAKIGVHHFARVGA
jgi:hypothetical protein